MPLQVVQVGEHVLGTARYLNAVHDRRHARVVQPASPEVNAYPPSLHP